MEILISSVTHRLSQIRKDLKSAILDKAKSQFDDYVKVDDLVVNGQVIKYISFDYGWRKVDLSLYIDKDKFDYISLSSIDDIYDLLKIASTVSDL